MSTKYDPSNDSSNSDSSDIEPEGYFGANLHTKVRESSVEVAEKPEFGLQNPRNLTNRCPASPPLPTEDYRNLNLNGGQSSRSSLNSKTSRFSIPQLNPVELTQSAANADITVTKGSQEVMSGIKPESMADKLRNRRRNQMLNTSLQRESTTTTGKSSSLLSDSSQYTATRNVLNTHGKNDVGKMSYSNSSVTPSTKFSSMRMNSEPSRTSRLGVSAANVLDNREYKSMTATGLISDMSQKRYEDIFLEKFAELQLEYVHRQTCQTFLEEVQRQSRKHNIICLSAEDETFKGYVKKVCDFLWQAVKTIEDDFDNLICFPPNETPKRLEVLRTIPDWGKLIPTKIVTALRKKLTAFNQEYTSRNETIQKQEKTSALELIDESVKYYIEQTLHQIGERYLDDSVVNQIDKDCKAKVEDIFVTAFGFRHDYWKTTLTTQLKLAMANSGRDVAVRQKLGNNKEVLERNLDDAGKNAIALYNQGISESVIRSVDEWKKTDSAIYKKVMKSYKDRVEEITKEQSKTLNPPKLFTFTDELNHAHNQARVNVLNDIKTKQEMDQQKKRNSKDPPKTKQKESTSTVTNHTGESLMNKYSYQKEVKSRDFKTNLYAIVNIGIDKTSCTYFDTSSKTLGKELEKENDDWFKNAGAKFEPKVFLRSMLGKPVDMAYDVTRDRQNLQWTILDFIIILFRIIKNHLEREAGHIDDCIIVLPQCLNIKQRDCFLNGAEIVGFTKSDIISDTHVIALKFLHGNPLPSQANVIAVHVSETIIDVTLFSRKAESVQCKAVAGDLFPSGKSSKWPFSFLNLWKNKEKGRIEDIFKPMISKEKLESTTHLVLFGHKRNCQELATTVMSITPFEKMTLSADSLIKGASVFAENIQEDMIKGYLDESLKNKVKSLNPGTGLIPNQCVSVIP